MAIAALTAWGGWQAGAFTLTLAAAATVFFLIEPRSSWQIAHPADLTEVVMLVCVGGLVIFTIDTARRERERARALRHQTEEALARQQAIVHAAPMGVLTCDAQGILTYANAETERIWGQPLAQVGREGYSRFGLFTPAGEVVLPEQTALARILAGERGLIHNELIIRRPGGSSVWVDAQSVAITDEAGQLLGGVTAMMDITARKQVETALIESEKRYRSLVEASAQIIWNTNPQGEFTSPQNHWSQFTGQTLEQLNGMGWLDAVHPDDREKLRLLWVDTLQRGTLLQTEHRLRRYDGVYRYFAVRAAPVMDASEKNIQEWVGIHNDVTERREVEEARARLLAEARVRAAREALLNQIGQTQRASDDPAVVQRVAITELGRELNADRCYFATVVPPRPGSGSVGASGGDVFVITEDFRTPGLPGLVGRYQISDFGLDPDTFFAGGNMPVVVGDVEKSALVVSPASLIAGGIRAFVAIPMWDGPQLVNVLMVAASRPRVWGDDEVQLAASVAAQTRTTLTLALLQQREHNIAERLQDTLRPTLPDHVPGLDVAFHYQAALAEASIGGDFFDVFALEKGCIALIIGDLSGKGLAAASQIAMVRNMLRFALYQGRTIAEAVSALNDTLTEQGLLTGFATLFVGLFDAGMQNITYVSGGHEPTLVRRATTGAIEQLLPTGPVVGAFSGVGYTQDVTPFASGDAIIIFTDGLSEAGRNRHEFLEVEGIAALVEETAPATSATALVQRIIAGVERHTGGTPHDDQCLLVAVARPRDVST